MIRPRWHLPALALCLLIALSACAVDVDEPPSPWTTSQPGGPDLVIDDDFSPPNAAWIRFDTPDVAVYPLEGELYLEDRGRGIAVYTPLNARSFSDVTLSTQMRHVQGSFNNWMGLICRQRDEDNYYLFAISADGFYTILRIVDGRSIPIVEPTESQFVQTGKAVNQVQVRCRDDRLTLWINDTLIVSRTDATFQQGGVALFADAVEPRETVTVAFDSFRLTSP